MQNNYSFGNFTPDFLDNLANILKDKKVLEICAGNGLLAFELQKRNIDIHPTTIFSGHDNHSMGMNTKVEELDAVSAVTTYRDEYDILLVSWPTTTEATFQASMEWGEHKPIIFIGEMPNHDLGLIYPGCASDMFFEATDIIQTIDSYKPKNIMDKACILQAKPDYVENYKKHSDFRFS